MQYCYLQALRFYHVHDGLVSNLERGLELGLSFSASVRALELHSQAVVAVFLLILLLLS